MTNEHELADSQCSDNYNNNYTEQDYDGYFDLAQCLFCEASNDNFEDNETHMLKSHGFFVPKQDQLSVDLETVFDCLHLIVSTHHQCLYCGTQRNNSAGVKQHMLAKGHCKIDLSTADSEYWQFYSTKESCSPEPEVQLDPTLLRLSSGKVVKHRAIHISRPRRQQHDQSSDTETDNITLDSALETTSLTTVDPENPKKLAKNERRNLTLFGQLDQLRESDRRAIAHLPPPQQRALLLVQKQQMSRAQDEERKSRSHLYAKANKTLMKHFVNDVPGRLLG